ncbi:MAG: FMN-binding protein [Candidatus Omnitrophica bacterium]|nr:FMN-binding protein [Candidatus Omnitrophota bacterium]
MKEKIKIIFFVIFLGIVSGSLLLGVNKFTEKRILQNQQLKIKKAVLDVFEIPYKKEDIETVFNQNIEIVKLDGVSFYISKNEKAVAFEFSGSGLWGPIHGVIAINNDMETIKGISIIHQEETPGLGGRIAEKDYLAQFKGKKFLPEIKIVPPGKSTGENQVDAITGATGTSKSFETLLNTNIQKKLNLFKQRR